MSGTGKKGIIIIILGIIINSYPWYNIMLVDLKSDILKSFISITVDDDLIKRVDFKI